VRLLLQCAIAAALVITSGCGGSSPTAPGSTIVYAALGASDAVGIGASPMTEGYVFVVSRRLDGLRAGLRVGVRLSNLGILGASVDTIAGTPLQQAIAAGPHVVTVWTGSNDVVRGAAPAAFADTLDRLLGELRARTTATIFVGDLADLTKAPQFRNQPDPDVTPARLAAFNQAIDAVVTARGCVLVRLSTLAIDDGSFAIDGFHPNNTGYGRIADAFWAAMEPRVR